MDCADCGSPTKVTRTTAVLGVTVRRINCPCGSTFETVEKIAKRLSEPGRSSAYVHTGSSLMPTGEQRRLPVIANALGDLGGPSASGSDLILYPNTAVLPIRGRARGRKGDVPAAFNAFWAVYPRRVAKQAAVRAWLKEVGSDLDLISQIMSAIEWQKIEFARREIDKVPHPASWLHGKRWNDERPHQNGTHQKTRMELAQDAEAAAWRDR